MVYDERVNKICIENQFLIQIVGDSCIFLFFISDKEKLLVQV